MPLSKKIGAAPSREPAPSPLLGPATLQTLGEKQQRPCHASPDGTDGSKLPPHQVGEGGCGDRAYIAGCSRTALELPIMITLRSARLEEDRHHALLDRALDDARATRKEPEHAVILAEHVGAEAREPALGPRANHLVEEHGPESQPLVAVLEHEGDLARQLLVRRLIAPDP